MFNDGAIFAQSFSQFTLINTNFTENSRNSVSTIDLFFSDLKCDGCTFEKNKFTPVSVSSQSTASFKNSHFYENHMQKRGSAIKLYRNAGTSYIENCYFYKNKALEGGLIIVTDSELVIENSVFEENESLSQDTPGIIITSSGVNITNSTFQNQTSQTSPIFISASSSDIKIDSCNFTEVIDLNYGFIYVASSFLQVKNSYFYHNGSASSEGTINSLNSDIYFDSCVFQDFLLSEDFQSKSIQASSGTLVMLNTKFEDFNENVMTLTSVKILSLTSCQFINGKYSEGVLVLNEVNDVMIFDCVFENISCVSHGSVINAKSSTTENSLYISNSLFANNTATLGGSFYAEGYNMTLKDSTLRNSQADYGGALYISNCECQIDNNVIINNSAHKSGGAIYFIGNEPILTNNMLDNNTALYGFNLASIPYQLSLVHESRELRIFDNVASSQTFQHVVKIALTDKFNDTVNYGYDDTEAIIVAESGVTLSGNIQIKPTYGVYSIENIKITAKPGSTTYIKLILGSLSVQNEIQLDIAMRECVPGEYQQKDACILCEDGKYSFDISHMCKNCPQNAKCYRGNIMAPYPGY